MRRGVFAISSGAISNPTNTRIAPQGNSYRICSLYIDSPQLFLYNQTVLGEKNRFKLRIRFYDDDPAHPAFLEIKRRVTDVILKETRRGHSGRRAAFARRRRSRPSLVGREKRQ